MRAIKEPLTTRERGHLYYEMLAGGARMKLLESIIALNLLEQFQDKKTIPEDELIRSLGLHPIRGKKWLFLLTRESFLKRILTDSVFSYALGPISLALSNNNDEGWWFFKQMTYSWQAIAYEYLPDILKGKQPYTADTHWPPKNTKDSLEIEEWMTRTITSPATSIEKAIDFKKVCNILDVGGGEATLAIRLAAKNPHLKINVYNLPTAISLAKYNIKKAGLENRINLITGNFLVDKVFPGEYDLIIFSRVLCDWSPKTSKRLLHMAKKSLKHNGRVAICEAFHEDNQDFSLGWEFRYIFWDELESEVFKSSLAYKKILVDLGYHIKGLSEKSDESIYRVLIAKKSSSSSFFSRWYKHWIARKHQQMLETGG